MILRVPGNGLPKPLLTKLLNIMRLTAILLFVACLQVHAETFSQKVTISGNALTLKQFVEKVKAQTGLAFVFDNAIAESTKNISVNVKNAEVTEVLQTCLATQGLTYTIKSNVVVITRAASFLKPEAGTTVAPPITVKGRVTNDKQSPIQGVTIVVKGTKRTLVTNEKGEFVLTEIESDATLEFSMAGFKQQEIKLSPAKTYLEIMLLEDQANLTDVVVTGFQKIDRKKFTGAAVTIKAEDVKIDGVIDVSRMLEGRAAGVSVQNVSGTFGAAPKVRVRGATSITGDNKPLWVVDGVVLEDIVNISNDQLSTGDPSTMLGSAVAGLNANDIETFDILKDAAAAALYGARAMNGVIVITTKRGKAGKPAIAYTGNFGVQLKPSYANYDIMNSADQMSVYAEMERKGSMNYSELKNAANTGVFGRLAQWMATYDTTTGFKAINYQPQRQAFLMKYANANTNWFDILFRNSLTQEHTLTVSSGTDKAQSYFSASFYKDNGWTLADNVKRYTFNSRNTYVASDRITFGFIASGSARQQTAPGTESRVANPVEGSYDRNFDINPFSYALNTSRVLTAFDDKGNLDYFTRDYAPFNIINETRTNNIKLGVYEAKLQGDFSVKISKNFKYDFVGAVRYAKTSEEHNVLESSNQAQAYRAGVSPIPNSIIQQANRFLYTDPNNPTAYPISVLPYGGFYNRTERQLLNYTIRNMITYNMSTANKEHQLVALAGQEIKSADRQTSNNVGVGYQWQNGGVPYIQYQFLKKMLEGNQSYYGMSNSYDRFAAFFANATYTFKNRYTVAGTVREDGSNRLGNSPQARWLPTWTVSGVWNVDQEDFIRNKITISHLMLKSSYGLNANIGEATNTTAILTTEITKRNYLSDQQTAIAIKNLQNSDLTWEKKYEFNIGTDIGLFKERLGVVFDFYNRRSFDLIALVKTAGIGGETFKAANYADMKSHGFEFSVSGKILTGKTVSWNSTFIFGYNTTRITNAKNTPMIFDLVVPEGGAKEGYAARGLFSIKNAGLDPYNGTPLFFNDSGTVSNGVYLQSQNTQYLKYEGSIDPTITGGFSNTFRYKQLSLNVLLTYQAGNKIRLTPAFKTKYSDLDAMSNQFKGRWSLPGDDLLTNVPSIADPYTASALSNASAYPYNNYNYSSARVVDGGFIRMKAISLSYALPARLVTRMGLKTMSLSAVGNNLWLIYSDKDLRGQDPEFFNSGGVAMPINKQVTFSLKVGL
ncbi:TonB-linked outer membrane protein, SusC/RagA family [Filimonas lacunae]|uniref:TonB-linked outer membrane protein, SusC/RagA family n=1 Tax=Filimonas lacunae TaxID=477680 RepID=A0A173MJU6_9BACT|nr:SusC/RagA family TonB-linked outer membrane protein [Filimonas lacunae]BAV07874.1 outer membrane protein, nutrient binding [Filimonas lacunae]SIT05883.1 TonB-linked outer membrane protein, SusC/RagA family [Filimonas lacunae]